MNRRWNTINSALDKAIQCVVQFDAKGVVKEISSLTVKLKKMTKKSRDRRVASRRTKRTTNALNDLTVTLKGVNYEGPNVQDLVNSLSNK